MKHSAFTVLLPDRGLDEVFQLLSRLGYDGVELRVKEDYHVAPDQLLSRVGRLTALMSQTGLEVPVLGTYLSVTDLETLLPVFEAADRLGATGVRVSLGPPLDGTRSYWDVLAEAQRGVEACGQGHPTVSGQGALRDPFPDGDCEPEPGLSPAQAVRSGTRRRHLRSRQHDHRGQGGLEARPGRDRGLSGPRTCQEHRLVSGKGLGVEMGGARHRDRGLGQR